MQPLEKDLKQLKTYFLSSLKGENIEKAVEDSYQKTLNLQKAYLPELTNIILLDILSQEKYTEEELPIFYDNLNSFLIELQEKGFFKEKELIECLEEDLLSNIGLIDKKVFMKKRIRLFTKKYYEQSKFNLLAENCEGYSVFIAKLFLVQECKDFEVIKRNFKEVIGYFNLDPNKVVDLLLEFLRCLNVKFDFVALKAENCLVRVILDFFGEIGREKVVKFCLNKLDYLPEREKGKSLLTVIAFLCKFDLLDLENVWDFLKPEENNLYTDFEVKRNANFNLLKNSFVFEIETSEEMSNKKEENIKKWKSEMNLKILKNHRLCFLELLLKVNNFGDFMKIFKKINYDFHFDNLEPLLSAIFLVTDYYVNPLFNFLNGKEVEKSNYEFHYKELKPFQFEKLDYEASINFLEKLEQLLELINTNLFYNSELYEKIVFCLIEIKKRLFSTSEKASNNKKDIKENSENPEKIEKEVNNSKASQDKNFSKEEIQAQKKIIIEKIKKIIEKNLLPSLFIKTLSIKNRKKGYSILSKLLMNLNFENRFEIYSKILESGLYENPNILNSELIIEGKKFIRNICDGKEQLEFNISKMNNLVQTNPFFIFLIFIKNVKLYKNLITSLCEASVEISDICKDIFIFLILAEFEKKNDNTFIRINDQVAQWFNNLCRFLSKFLKFNFQVDLKIIFIFILNKLKIEEGNEFLYLILVENIFIEFLGFEIIHHLNSEQFVGVLGGINLKAVIFHFENKFYLPKKNRNGLFRFLNEEKEFVNEDNEFSFFWLLYFFVCKQYVRISYKLSSFSLNFVNSFLDFVQDLKNLMLILRKITLKKNNVLTNDDLLRNVEFITQNKIGLLPVDILTISRIMIREEFNYVDNEGFNKFQNLIKKNFGLIFKEEKFALSSLFNKEIKKIDKTSTEFDFLMLFWYLENFDIFSPTEIYDIQITKIKLKIEDLKKSKESSNEIKLKIKNQEKILKKFQKEMTNQDKQIEQFKNFVKNNEIFSKEKLSLNYFIQQGVLLRYSLSIQDSFLSVKFIEIFNLPYCDNFCEFFDTVFSIVNKFLPGLSCMTQNETKNLGNFLLIFFNLKKYIHDDKFEEKIKEYLKNANFLEKNCKFLKEIEKNEFDFKSLKKLLLKKFGKIAENLTAEFSRNSIIFVKNLILLFLTIFPIFPKSKKHIEIILTMIKNGETIINQYPDLKNRCVTLKNKLIQKLDSLENDKISKKSKNFQKEIKKAINFSDNIKKHPRNNALNNLRNINRTNFNKNTEKPDNKYENNYNKNEKKNNYKNEKKNYNKNEKKNNYTKIDNKNNYNKIDNRNNYNKIDNRINRNNYNKNDNRNIYNKNDRNNYGKNDRNFNVNESDKESYVGKDNFSVRSKRSNRSKKHKEETYNYTNKSSYRKKRYN